MYCDSDMIYIARGQMELVKGELPVQANEVAVSEYFLEVLAVETGLHNVSDYIYWPNEIGLDLHADLEEITARILADSKS